ncbi:MAG: rhomboid family intramembrane serine protease [Planctomycetaceae bacterium]
MGDGGDMGFEDREYYRDPEWQPEGGGGGGGSTTIRWLIGLSVVVFLGQNIGSLRVTEWLKLTTDDTLSHWQLWRLLTYAFCHSTEKLLHLVFNMLCLWFFGRTLLDRLGSREFVAFYLVAAVVAGLSFLGLHSGFLDQPASAVGASGVVMAVMAVFAMWYPRQEVLLMGLIPIQIRWLVAVYVVIDTVPIWSALRGDEVNDGVAHAAHLGGLLFGFAYVLFELRLSNWLGLRQVPAWWRERERRKSVRLYSPETDAEESSPENDLDAKVDDILRKIHEHGEASLTSRERKILAEASRRYRERSRTP